MNRQKDLNDIVNGWLQENAIDDQHPHDWLVHCFDKKGDWVDLLDEREDKEIDFSLLYSRDFAHGTAGHNRLMLVAKLARLLDTYEHALQKMVAYTDSGEL